MPHRSNTIASPSGNADAAVYVDSATGLGRRRAIRTRKLCNLYHLETSYSHEIQISTSSMLSESLKLPDGVRSKSGFQTLLISFLYTLSTEP